MDEKTEELRDIFMDVADDGTVTESQTESPGSLATGDEGVDDRIAGVIERLRDRFEFETSLGEDALVAVVRGFYEDDDDAAIADALADADGASGDVDAETVFRARMDLHLFRDADVDAPFDLDAVRDLPDDAVEGVARDLGVDPSTVRRYRRAVAARTEARQVSHRFRSEFEDAVAEAGLATTMTESMRDDGLDEATEDIGSLEEDADVSF